MLKQLPCILLACMFSATYALNCSAAAQVSISQAELLSVGCFSCHGREGVGAKRIPKLSKLTKQEISEGLYGFKSGEERSTIMQRHAKAYTDQEIDLIAGYIANLKKK